MPIVGILVWMRICDDDDSGTDDHIYIGVWGRAGGREFALSDSKNYRRFKTGDEQMFLLGEKAFSIEAPFILPYQSRPGEQNDPAYLPLELSTVEYVYVRKQSRGTGKGDDAWKVRLLQISLYDAVPVEENHYRQFLLDIPDGLWIANEHGHQVWLTESLDQVSSPVRSQVAR